MYVKRKEIDYKIISFSQIEWTFTDTHIIVQDQQKCVEYLVKWSLVHPLPKESMSEKLLILLKLTWIDKWLSSHRTNVCDI